MSTVLAARANHLRRAHAALETLVLDDGAGRLRVRKRVPSWAPAEGRVEALLAARQRVESSGARLRVPALLDRGDDFVDLEYAAGEPVLVRIERALLERRFDSASAVIGQVVALLETFPTEEVDPGTHPGFCEVFGKGAAGPELCVVPGLYDFGLDNLVFGSHDQPPVLVDFEWAFPFVVPRKFVRWVGVRHTAEYLQPLVRALTSPALPGVVLFDDVVIPERWLIEAALDPADTRRFLAWECAFQGWLHIVHRRFDQHVVHENPGRVDARVDENAAGLLGRLENQMLAAGDEVRGLEHELEVARVEAREAQRRLAELAGIRRSAVNLGRLVARKVRRGERTAAGRRGRS